MKSLSDYSLVELRWLIALKEKIEALQGELDAIAGEVAASSPAAAPTPTRRKYLMTAAHKRKLMEALAKARKIRSAKLKAAKRGKKKDRRSSPAVRAKLRAAAKARWAKVRAEGKRTM
ncbi:MAG: hypothetical protein ABSG78_20330 [Verrucomicrobiota bacterium]|jgi:hypothetical protein